MNPLDRADADTERNRLQRERIEVLRDALKIELLAAMANGEGKLRAFSLPHPDGRADLVELSLIDSLHDLLDAPDGALWRALVNVLQHSECSEVASWRLLAASQYAERAEDIATMEEQ